MEPIEVMLAKELLRAVDCMVRQSKRNRFAPLRDALREYIRRLEIRALERLDREGYSRRPQSPDESRAWEAEAAWPTE